MVRRDVRRMALEVLNRLERERLNADEALSRCYDALDPRDRRLLTELVMGVLRHRSRLDWVLSQFSDKDFYHLSRTVKNLLRLGAYQLLFLERIPARAAVAEAVRLAGEKRIAPMKGFVNAVLRQLDRGRDTLTYPDPDVDFVRYLTIYHSHPEWMVRRWLKRFGPERTEQLCRANNEMPPLTLRVNRLRTTREALHQRLAETGHRAEYCRISPVGLRLEKGAVTELTGYREGWYTVQDEAAQLVVEVLDPRPGEWVLDACSAPGGKTTQMAERMGNTGRVIALDRDGRRLELVRQACDRLGIGIVRCVQSDARIFHRACRQPFDRVLVDAPCSGLGVLRRNPEGKWRKSEDLIGHYARLQLEILAGVGDLVRPGGVLVYSTCTVEREENEEVVEAFLRSRPGYRLDHLRGHLPDEAEPYITDEGYFYTAFNRDRMDGFFVARLIRER